VDHVYTELLVVKLYTGRMLKSGKKENRRAGGYAARTDFLASREEHRIAARSRLKPTSA
jgi:hypothetical protein